jgi:hypothetical protein
VLGSLKPVWGVNNATLPSCLESKLANENGSERLEPSKKGTRRNMPFDQNDLIWGHSVQILPLVIWVVFDQERFSLIVRFYKSH